jgi:transcriptional regulator with XRE-family HTH domain
MEEMNIDHVQVASRIRGIMRGLGLTQAGLAQALSTTQPAVSKYLQGRMPPAEVLYRLAGLAEVSMEWILTGRDTRSFQWIAEPSGTYQTDHAIDARLASLPENIRNAVQTVIEYLAARS